MNQQLKAKAIIAGIGITGASVAAVAIGGTLGRDVANIIVIGTAFMVLFT